MPSDSLPAFQVLAKPIGPICNLDCSYCFYLEKDQLYPEVKHFIMEADVLETFIQQKIEGHRVDTVHFTWQGGEPTLLGVDYFREVVRVQAKYAGSKRIENGFQTNGVLLNDEWCQFFKKHNFLLGLSIDGPEELHDKYRVNKGGDGSFAQVMAALELLKKHGVEYNTLTVVNAGNQGHPDEVYDFLKSIGSTYWQFIPVVERIRDLDGLLATPEETGEIPISAWSVDPNTYGNFLERIFQRWVREDVGQIFVQHFESALANQLRVPVGVCVWNETCGSSLAMEHNGDVYSCDHYVFPQYKLGNVKEIPLIELVHDPIQIEFGNDKKDKLPQICLDCEVLDLCHGECPKHRFMTGTDGEVGLNYLCDGYKHFFTSIRPELGVITELFELGKPAENIKEWMIEKDLGFPSLKVKRNDFCPCGSGKIFKVCCAK
ncbi:MAG: anaerobic sulfatase maturase [Candidatus Marinimicrobia bacterium]|nr:anaerobic sulfatase maturase [Candidatus Neomarinimicrobiota bacterium]